VEKLLQGLRAAAEPTRLRIIALCGHAELSVTELVMILGQTQPRVSRHLKLLVEGGLLQRNKEGNRAYYRLSTEAEGADLARMLNDLMPGEDEVHALDLSRLSSVKADRVRYAESFLDPYSQEIIELRGMWPPDEVIDKCILALLKDRSIQNLLDLGTGAGRILRTIAPFVEKGTGIDNSLEMLSIARARLDQDGIKNCQVRVGDMYRLPFKKNSFDLITINSLLRYADEPKKVIAEAARVLEKKGALLIVDLAAHDLSALRDEYGHSWLGFSEAEMVEMLSEENLTVDRVKHIDGQKLSVCIWLASGS
jgi:SAM-dependent methyltransferase